MGTGWVEPENRLWPRREVRDTTKESNVVVISPGSFEKATLLPEGTYLARIISAKEGKSSLKNTPGIFIELKVVSGEHKGEIIRDSLWLTPAAGRMVVAKLYAAGIKMNGEDFDLDVDDLLTKLVVIKVKHQEYEGETRAQVGNWKIYEPPPNDLVPTPAPEPEKPADDLDDVPF